MKNRLLKYLVYFTNLKPEEYKEGADGISLSVNGILITGRLVPRKYFYEAEQNVALRSLTAPVTDLVVEESQVEAEESEIDIEEEVDKITLLHLKDAFYMSGSQRFPSNGSMYIAINFDSIDAYSMGAFNPG